MNVNNGVTYEFQASKEACDADCQPSSALEAQNLLGFRVLCDSRALSCFVRWDDPDPALILSLMSVVL